MAELHAIILLGQPPHDPGHARRRGVELAETSHLVTASPSATTTAFGPLATVHRDARQFPFSRMLACSEPKSLPEPLSAGIMACASGTCPKVSGSPSGCSAAKTLEVEALSAARAKEPVLRWPLSDPDGSQ